MRIPAMTLWGLIGVAAVAVAQPAAKQQPPTQIDPRAAALVRRMSDQLQSMQSFRVESGVIDEVVTKSGQKIQLASDSQLAVRRPDRLRSERIGPAADVTFRYDGRQFSLLGKRTGYYAIAAAPPNLDQAIDVARERFGLDAPGADLLMSRPYDVLMQDVVSGKYIGVEPIDGTLCHHVAFQGRDVDWQLWIEDGPRALPRRYVVTSKRVPGQPEFTVRLSNWQPQAALPETLFQFTPPPGAKKIELLELSKNK